MESLVSRGNPPGYRSSVPLSENSEGRADAYDALDDLLDSPACGGAKIQKVPPVLCREKNYERGRRRIGKKRAADRLRTREAGALRGPHVARPSEGKALDFREAGPRQALSGQPASSALDEKARLAAGTPSTPTHRVSIVVVQAGRLVRVPPHGRRGAIWWKRVVKAWCVLARGRGVRRRGGGVRANARHRRGSSAPDKCPRPQRSRRREERGCRTRRRIGGIRYSVALQLKPVERVRPDTPSTPS